jgi:UDP-N-acetylmuramate--alanine ligase
VLCLDDPVVQSLIPGVKRRIITYGTAAQADVSITDINTDHLCSSFTVRFN